MSLEVILHPIAVFTFCSRDLLVSRDARHRPIQELRPPKLDYARDTLGRALSARDQVGKRQLLYDQTTRATWICST